MGAFYFGAFLTGVAAVILVLRHSAPWKTDLVSATAWVTGGLLAAALTWYVTGSLDGLLLPWAGCLVFAVLARVFFPHLTSFGAGLLASRLYLPVCAMLLVHAGVQGSDWPALAWISYYAAQSLVLALAVIGTLLGGLSFLPEFCFRYPKRDSTLKTIASGHENWSPKISIHVPCYAEPPDLVIKTLDAISRLRYTNFEVLVVDNNTKDPDLWEPVCAHCKTLGERFRFFHVDPLPGAKAGAINFALRHTAPGVEIIAVIDADYIAEPDFLCRFVSLFRDPSTAFVQTSHDYRQWQGNPFLSGAYYECMPRQKMLQPITNEFDAAYTVGTMCLVRRRALEEAGGWAPWALTEDSELAVRIHALGYKGHVFADTWGRGLIPETMEGVKKQQFRWSAGPLQQFMVHWRLYFGLDSRGRLTFMQKMLEIKHSLEYLPTALGTLMVLAMLAFSANSVVSGESADVPPGVLAVAVAGAFLAYTKKWIEVRRLGGNRTTDFIYAVVMEEALRWTYIKAFFIPLFRFRLAWNRTDKFAKSSSLGRAFHSSRVETLIAMACFATAAAFAFFADFDRFDCVALTAVVVAFQGSSFMCTLAMAFVGEKTLSSNRSVSAVKGGTFRKSRLSESA